MSAFLSGLLDDLHDRLILLIDYSPHARRLLLRIQTRADDEDGGPLVRTLMFDGVVGVHCTPIDALILPDGETGEILRFDGKQRNTGEYEFSLSFLGGPRGDDFRFVSFLAQAARWMG